ncbi:hypothetical protein BT63DRAFT_316262 [Microthyrium microscopicum]|uniref:Uncharacterized protein n=1 Tax=Microthyrium microscopicum TaxID=703497 RepID=A0A6A6U360_9PEZI|nr:hypothetical protein BT63DRAFT_316262 [Microthyrium microscopicum]
MSSSPSPNPPESPPRKSKATPKATSSKSAKPPPKPSQAPKTSQAPSPKPPQDANAEAPPPVQVTSASIYSHDDHQPDDADPGHLEVPADTHDNDDDSENDDGYPPIDEDAPATSLLPPPSFKPLFSLISDPLTNETHHPSVYYVFSDDADNEREGHDVATIAALRALDQNSQQVGDEGGEESEAEERFILLDMEPTEGQDELGLKVRNIASLSPAWAITAANLRPAPTFEEDEESESLMLTIEGLELADPGSGASHRKPVGRIKEEAEQKAADLLQEARKRGGGGVVDGLGELWRHLSEGLAVLDKVTGDEGPRSS